MSNWLPMDTAPRDGSSFDVQCNTPHGKLHVVTNLHYGPKPMRDGTLILWGTHNFLSPYFTPIGWRPMEKKI